MQPTPPSPFNPGQPRSEGGPSRSRPLLIGCGAVLILLGIAAVVLVAKMPALVDWVFHRFEQQVLAKLPPDVTPEERARLDAAFDDAARAIGENRADAGKVQQLNASLMEMGQPGRKITREDALKLLQTLDEVAGKKPPPSTP
jgi:hypothetical protein